MPVPNLIHPINVTVMAIHKAATRYDDDAREPVRSVTRRTPLVVPAQVSYQIPRPDLLPIGVSEKASGYMLFRRVDLLARGYAPARGDKFSKVGHETADLYVLHVEPLGHYQDQNGSTLVRAYFADRQPATGVPRP
jgi:hypothetical protein